MSSSSQNPKERKASEPTNGSTPPGGGNDERPYSVGKQPPKPMTTEPISGILTEDDFKCQICGQVFKNQQDLDEHLRSHEEVQKRIEKRAQLAFPEHQTHIS